MRLATSARSSGHSFFPILSVVLTWSVALGARNLDSVGWVSARRSVWRTTFASVLTSPRACGCVENAPPAASTQQILDPDRYPPHLGNAELHDALDLVWVHGVQIGAVVAIAFGDEDE